ncbi:MAG TPA: DUF1549 and DUF1553 domain-containing protein [Gemmataceae bacterium]|jgi:hypothetical protein
MTPHRTRRLTLAAVLAAAAVAPAEPPADHWAWHPVVRPVVPECGPTARNPIDAFVRARLAAAGLSPGDPLRGYPAADRATLIRRATYDLTGLPPTPEEIDAFVSDSAADAWEKVVDRLLASPHYGERWGRHWLDLARYADSNGYEFDEPRPDAWRYRDYVFRSLNADKPYDRFVTEQLAGDEAFPGDRDAEIATGFNLLGPDMTDSSDQAQRRLNTLADMTDTAGLAFLGLTVGCARCHDHKFEPISQADYYRLLAYFAPAAFRRDLDIASAAERAAHDARMRDYDALTHKLRDQIATLEGPARERLFDAKLAKLSPEARAAHRTPEPQRTGGQQELVAETERKVAVSAAEIAKALSAADRARLQDLKRRLAAFDDHKPAPLPVALGLADRPGPPPKTYLLERGELANRAGEVEPGTPAILGQSVPVGTHRRLVLARWVASPDNPLTARVIVNRLWQRHFGRGLVATPSDFGQRGERPTHPELLDWLAAELVSDGWRLKPIHRLMLLSETYQQSADVSAAAAAADPDNRLLSRMTRRRLEGEAVRDALLAVSGRLNPAMGGPGVTNPKHQAPNPKSATGKLGFGAWDLGFRRSVYLFARRNVRDPFLEAFDLPDSNLSCPRRERSTTAPQALALLNAAEATEAAQALAERLTREAVTEDGRIERAYRLTLGRPPTPTERDRAAAFLRESPLSELCRALFNLNEFVYLD